MPGTETTAGTVVAAPRRTVTRDDLLQLGRSGRPWAYLPAAMQALNQVPRDTGLRLLAAANFARLGLVTPAREQLAAAAAAVADDPAATQLARLIDGLPADTVPAATRIQTCRANVEALAARGIDLSAGFADWSNAADSVVCVRAHDGNVLRRRPLDGPLAWIGLGDQRGAAERFAQQYLGETEELRRPPVVIEGIDPPWLLQKVVEHTAESKIGYRPRITVVQADPRELLDGLSLCDLRDAIRDPRVAFFVGAGAAAALLEDLRGRFDAEVVGRYVSLPGVRTRVEPRIETVIAQAQGEQQAEAERLDRDLERTYGNRDRAWWAARYAEAIGGSGPPLRVLVITTRYSTYIQHASRDLATEYERAGCETDVIIEPDPWTRLSSVGYMRRFGRLEPDLVVLINYTRANTGGMIPQQVPFVCWLQDAMWHQLDPQVAAGQTELDFLVGHLFAALFETAGYPRRNTLSFPVAVSPSKFHDRPADPGLRRRHECEIAYVGHQSETPQRQRDRIINELAHDPALQRCIEAIHPRLVELVSAPFERNRPRQLPRLVDETLGEVIGEVDPALACHVLTLWAEPMADRIARHEALEWAADVAGRRGWRFRVYGRGWDEHPRLAPYAQPEIDHGEELRACYQAAAAHLHVTYNTNRHQRVVECALSGGLPLCRRHRSDLDAILKHALCRLVRAGDPVVCNVKTRSVGYRIADHAEAMAAAAVRQRCGIGPRGPFLMYRQRDVDRARGGELQSSRDDAWLLGDPAEVTFASAGELERLVERALERPAWRRNAAAAIARRAMRSCTTGVLAQRVIETVRASFS